MPKKIIIVGATGLIGKYLTKRLLSLNYEVVSFSRSINYSKKILPFVNEHIPFHYNYKNDWAPYFEDAYALINLAGASLSKKRLTEKYKVEVSKSRILTTNTLTQTLLKCFTPPDVFISASAIGIYGDQNETVIRDDNPVGKDFLSRLCLEWEETALQASNVTRVVIPRFSVVLAKDSIAFKKMLLPFKLFLGGKIASGQQWFSWIHIDDVVEMLITTLENNEWSGSFNCSSPEPVRNIDFTKILAKKLKVPSFFKIPEFMLRFALGDAADMVLASQRVIPKYATLKNYEFKYDTLDKALNELLSK